MIGTRNGEMKNAFQFITGDPSLQTVISTRVEVHPRLSRGTKNGKFAFVRVRNESLYKGSETLAMY